MPLSWNEIKIRATAFSKEWKHESSEDAEAKSFWDGFFNIFDIKRRRIATFEHHVKKLNTRDGFIDLFWPGMLIAEHKSRGKNLDKAFTQAIDYSSVLTDKELPRFIIISDFENIRLYDLEAATQTDIKLSELTANIKLFGFIAGYEKRTYKEQDPANIQAAELMGRLHDKLKAIGYSGHQLELYLVRLLFCLFADDTNIFEKDILHDYLQQKTNEDGSDLARAIAELFQVLNTAPQQRFTNLDESLAAFPYINGKLFEENLPLASFDSSMRKILLDCCGLDWGKISPAIFGSLFQSVMDEKARRNLGAHYTSEKNILKVIKPLFLDELWKDFEKAKPNVNVLKKLHDKISKLRFLDPACGCGNFLIIAYRELRLLELELVKAILKNQTVTSINDYFLVEVDQFYGIEYEEFPAQIAPVAMWLMDHQINMLASDDFGEYYVRLPLKKSATIVHGNALRIDWQSLLQPTLSDLWKKEEVDDLRYNYIFGNPPFIGKSLQNDSQKKDMAAIFNGVNGAGVLDYVAAWYIKAAAYMNHKAGNETKTAFVSTNSISQGEQVGILWNELFNNYHCKIHFAHRTFKWGNEAKGNAAVHVVIIGFADFDVNEKGIFEYDDIKGEPHELRVKNINPYLVAGNDIFLNKRRQPICEVPEMTYGSMANDGGNLLMDDIEKAEIIKRCPNASKFIKKFVMGEELINNISRWCLWLEDCLPGDLRQMPEVLNRVEAVRKLRLSSSRKATQELANFPTRFGEMRQPKSAFLALPRVSSENRNYIPITIFPKDIIAGDKVYTIEKYTSYCFGVLLSQMHMSWMRTTSGRMKSDYSYTNQITYNNFPWPENPTDKQKEAVEAAAQLVLDVRKSFMEPVTEGAPVKGASLADLYDPNTMPPALVKAHQQLDKAVDLCYRSQPFANESKRIEYLFELYDKYTAGIFVKEKKIKGKRIVDDII